MKIELHLLPEEAAALATFLDTALVQSRHQMSTHAERAVEYARDRIINGAMRTKLPPGVTLPAVHERQQTQRTCKFCGRRGGIAYTDGTVAHPRCYAFHTKKGE